MKRTVSLMVSLAMVFILAACSSSAALEGQEEASGSAAIRSDEAEYTIQKTMEQSKTSQDTKQGTEAQNGVPQITETYLESRQKTETQSGTIQETEIQAKGQQDVISETEESESVSTGEQEKETKMKILVVYFSCTGTTRTLAEYVAEILEADLYEIEAEDPYTEEDLAYYTGGRADQEQNDPDARPAISGSVENMDSYDTILIGYPVWHGQAPRIISTFLESYDFSGKTMVPFCTSHSSGIGSSAANLQGLCSDSAEWMEGRRFGAGTARDTVEEWLLQIL